jgi:3',5'-cyclic AMP phosphodiesterase CpdA
MNACKERRWRLMDHLSKPVMLFLMVMLTAITGCYSFIGRYGAPFYEGDEQKYFEAMIDRAYSGFDQDFHPELAPEGDLPPVQSSTSLETPCLTQPVLLRFVWLSDVQLRQKEVKLFSRRVSHTLDDVISSFEHNDVQEEFDWAVYLSYILTVNRLHKDKPIDFLIHTGDAIDAGTVEELYQFIYITNKLNVPWLNLVGNHDVSIFGNYEDRLAYTRQATVSFYPVGNLQSFLYMHRRERTISGFGQHLLPTPSEGGHPASEDGNEKIPGTYCHGFDLTPEMNPNVASRIQADCSKTPGYYAFDVAEGRIPIRVIVLNSARSEGWGPDGKIENDQRDWLEQMLEGTRNRLSLIFSHHRPEDFDDKTMDVLVDGRNGPLLFFSGHSHKHDLKFHDSLVGHGFYELNTGSILEYPQAARLIEVRGVPGQTGCLVSRLLWNTYLALDDVLIMDKLEEVLSECKANRYGLRKIPYKAVRCGHYGAIKDHVERREKPWGRPQSYDEAWEEANVIIPVMIPEGR